MGTAERRQRERGEMRDAIIDAALELFLTDGFEQTSIRRIAEKIEYTPGAIYSYFKDKDEILYEIHIKGFVKLFEYLKKAREESNPMDKLYQTGRLYMKFAFEYPEHYDLMFISRAIPRSFGDKKEWEEGDHAYKVLHEAVGECMAANLLPTCDVNAASYAFWSMVHGMISLMLRKRCMLCPEIYHQQLLLDAYDFMFSTIRKQG
jgi:AcrR family transcriptional regulator